MSKIMNKIEYCQKCFAELNSNYECEDCEVDKERFPKSKDASKCFAPIDYKKLFAPNLEGKTWVKVKGKYAN